MKARAHFRALGQKAAAWRLPDRVAFRLLTGLHPWQVPYWAFEAFADGHCDQSGRWTRDERRPLVPHPLNSPVRRR